MSKSEDAKRLTGTRSRAIAVPVTRQEQLDKLRAKNPAIDLLIDKFKLVAPL